jgi:hypothetical protein
MIDKRHIVEAINIGHLILDDARSETYSKMHDVQFVDKVRATLIEQVGVANPTENHIRDFIGDLQVHRGLTATFFSENDSFRLLTLREAEKIRVLNQEEKKEVDLFTAIIVFKGNREAAELSIKRNSGETLSPAEEMVIEMAVEASCKRSWFPSSGW